MKVFFSPHLEQHFWFLVSWTTIILIDLRWYLSVILIYSVSFPVSVGISICSLDKCLFRSFAHFWTEVFFLLLRYLSHLYVLGINPFSDVNLQFVSTFSHFVDCLFTTCWPVALGFICCNTKALNFSSLFFLLRLLFCFCFCSLNLSLILITSIKSLLWFWLKFHLAYS